MFVKQQPLAHSLTKSTESFLWISKNIDITYMILLTKLKLLWRYEYDLLWFLHWNFGLFVMRFHGFFLYEENLLRSSFPPGTNFIHRVSWWNSSTRNKFYPLCHLMEIYLYLHSLVAQDRVLYYTGYSAIQHASSKY